MATLGVEIVQDGRPAARFWLASSDTITDAAAFLVRAGSMPLLSRVCYLSDLYNWPSEETSGYGWYRVAGIQVPLEGGQDLDLYHDKLEDDFGELDYTAGETPTTSTESYDLRYHSDGDTFGSLSLSLEARDSTRKIDVSVEITDTDLNALLPAGLFVSESDSFALSRVIALADGLGESLDSGEALVASFTCWMDVAHVQGFADALTGDIEDYCTYAAVNGGLSVL